MWYDGPDASRAPERRLAESMDRDGGRVAERLNRARGSNYLERARDYVRKHYREKIYLEDVAETLGISPSYLSRLFKKESGQSLQDFINEERVYRAAEAPNG